jgi:peptidyl-prolyl cis-trans isomerase-like protein 2
MANSGPRTNGSQFFFTFSPSTHLDGKHTVFGKLVGGEDTLDRIEAVKVRPGGDNRPVKDIIIQSVQVYVPLVHILASNTVLTGSLTDPFEEYQKRLKARLAHRDQSDEALRKRALDREERDKDRTTWLGTELGARGETKAEKEKRKRVEDDEGGTVGKYLQGGQKAAPPAAATQTMEFGLEKKKKKGGGFGNFSGW